MPDTLILIPARLASTRLPGKPLADLHGAPMIVHVLRRAEAAGIGDAVVATDSEAVAAAVEKAGGRAVMTRSDHESGSDRIYEALEAVDPEHRIEIVVNIQGDLPTVGSDDIRAALKPLADRNVDIATLAAVITDPAERTNPNVVKVAGRERATREAGAIAGLGQRHAYRCDGREKRAARRRYAGRFREGAQTARRLTRLPMSAYGTTTR